MGRVATSVLVLLIILITLLPLLCLALASSADSSSPPAAATSPLPNSGAHHHHHNNHAPNEFCCCPSSAVEDNAQPLLALLEQIVTRPYFRIFRVNVKRPCSYWAVQSICSLAHNPCSVCRCDPRDVPVAFQREGDMGVLPEDYNRAPIVRTEAFASSSDTSGKPQVYYGHQQFLSPHSWNEQQPTVKGGGGGKASSLAGMTSTSSVGGSSSSSMFAAFDDEEAEFVDLRMNPEGYTGYQGKRIWDAIYNENCFRDDATVSSKLFDTMLETDSTTPPRQCSQQRVLYELVSGLQTSIAVHLSMHQPDAHDPTRIRKNCTHLHEHVLSHPERIRNLHTLYQFVLRAVTRAAGAFLSLADDTNPHVVSDYNRYLHDKELVQLLRDLFHEKLLCSNTFNETKFLEMPFSSVMVAEMKRKMHNITTLMDCVACEKCRLWGKLQTIGLATALKIIAQPQDVSFVLSRSESVSLMNLVRQLSVSVVAVTTECGQAQDGG